MRALRRTMTSGICLPSLLPCITCLKTVFLPYAELGLVNTKELFKKAVSGGYAIPAYNFNNLEQI